MSSRGVQVELQRTADVLAGRAQLEVSGGQLGIPEDLLETVVASPGVEAAAPLVEAAMRIAQGPYAGSAVHVLGVDLLADPDVRAYRVEAGAIGQGEPLRVIAGSNAVIVPRALADKLELALGDTLGLVRDGRRVDLAVQAILLPGGLSEAFDGHVVIMDLYNLQQALGRRGWFDRIDVVVSEPDELELAAAILQRRVEGVASVRRAAQRDAWVENSLAAIRFVVWGLVGVGVIVAGLLTYTTMSLAVDRRLEEFALLRAAGLEAGRVRRLVLLDTLVLSALGTGAGLFLGSLVARRFTAVLSMVSSYLQDVEIGDIAVTPSTVAIGLAVGAGVGLLACIEPARRASLRAPLEVLSAHRAPAAPPRAQLRSAAGYYLGIGLPWLVLAIHPLGLPALLHLGLIFGLGMALIGRAARDLFPRLVVRLRPTLARLSGGVGSLTGASLLARPFHSAVTVATVAGVVAGVAVTLILVRSLGSTLDDWTAGQYPGSIFVVAGNPLHGASREKLQPDVVEAVRGTPGVRAVFDHYTANILYRGEEVLLGASSMGVMARYGHLPVIDGDARRLALDLASGAIAISDQFAGHFGVAVGDELTLATPVGPRSFRVAGVLRDYAGPAGSLNIDLAVFDEIWQREGSSNLVIWTEEPKEPVLDEIRRRTQDDQKLFFVFGEELERYASQVIGQFTRLLDVVSILTAGLGAIAIMNLLLTAVVERRRELALLRAAGATNGQLMGLIVLEGAIVSIAGSASGLLLGVACAYPMVTGVVRIAFSWWLLLEIDPLQLLALGLTFVAASVLAALAPAWQARQLRISEFLAPE
jgi:putative ABC transport system permease protein